MMDATGEPDLHRHGNRSYTAKLTKRRYVLFFFDLLRSAFVSLVSSSHHTSVMEFANDLLTRESEVSKRSRGVVRCGWTLLMTIYKREAFNESHKPLERTLASDDRLVLF